MILSYINQVDAATAVLTASSAAATLPAANVKDPRVALPWRTTTPSSTILDIDFGTAVPMRIISIFGINISATDTINIQAGTTGAGSTDVINTGAVASGVLPDYQQFIWAFNGTSLSARYLRITIAAPSRVSAGFVDVGRVWVGDYFAPRFLPANFDMAFIDSARTIIGERSGTAYIDLTYKKRSVQFGFPILPSTDMETFREIDRVVGRSGQLVSCLRPFDNTQNRREAILGYIVDNSPIQYRTVDGGIGFSKQYRLLQA